MKRGKSIRVILCLLCLAVVGVTWAMPENAVKIEQRLETGKVKIRLQQITAEGGGVRDLVEPNKDLKYIPRIINKEAECYVRAKVKISEDGKSWELINEKNLLGIGEGWVKRGGYFYYQKAMARGQSTDLFKGIHIPEDWNGKGNTELSVSVTAEAVQSRNFQPDFSRELPWGAVELEEAVSSAVTVTPVKDMAVISFSDGKGVECSTTDLFPGYSEMMPGDRLCRELELKNTSSKKLDLYMRISAGGDGISRKALMKVSAGGELLYEGSVAGACRNDELRLPSVEKGRSGTVMVEIELPSDADNTLAGLKDDIAWSVWAESVKDGTAQTGDDSNLMPFVIAALAALCLMAVLFRRRKGKQ